VRQWPSPVPAPYRARHNIVSRRRRRGRRLFVRGDSDPAVLVDPQRHDGIEQIDALRTEISDQHAAVENDLGAGRGRNRRTVPAFDDDVAHTQDRLTGRILAEARFAYPDAGALSELRFERALHDRPGDIEGHQPADQYDVDRGETGEDQRGELQRGNAAATFAETGPPRTREPEANSTPGAGLVAMMRWVGMRPMMRLFFMGVLPMAG